MRLCVVANPYSIHTHRWVRFFAGRGHDIHLVGVSPKPGTLPPHTLPDEVTVYELSAQAGVPKYRYLAWALKTRQIVRRIAPHVVHAHQIAGDGWVGAATGFHPFVATAWGSDLLVGPRRSWIQRQLARWVLSRADHVTCVSESLAQTARALGVPPQRLEVAPWGVDTDIFHPQSDSPPLSADFGIPSDTHPVVLSLRPIRALYNPLDVARAIPLVLQHVPDAHFVVRTYGSEPVLLTEFETLVQGCSTHVHYVGDLPDERSIAALYRLADVAISVPASDGTPSSVLEAMACGTVPVLSDVVSLHEWAAHEGEALFVPVGDADALVVSVVRLIRDADLRHRLRDAGLRLIRERADAHVLMLRAEEMYARLAGRPDAKSVF